MNRNFVRRSQLVTPAASEKMILKALASPCDSVVIDLEDGVAPSAKADARAALRRILNGRHEDCKEIAVRINDLTTSWFLDDVLALRELPIDSLVAPKVRDAADVRVYEAMAGQLQASGNARRPLTLQLLIESAEGIRNLDSIATASHRIRSLILGAADLVADVGCLWTEAALSHIRSRIVLSAAAAGLQAIDSVYPDYKDRPGLQAQSETARELGFTGKWAIHPDQLECINSAFSPTKEEIRQAEGMLRAHETALATGSGVAVFEGRLVDEASMRWVRRIALLREQTLPTASAAARSKSAGEGS